MKKKIYYICPDDYNGQHGTDYYTKEMTKAEYEKIKQERRDCYITDSYMSVLYWIQD